MILSIGGDPEEGELARVIHECTTARPHILCRQRWYGSVDEKAGILSVGSWERRVDEPTLCWQTMKAQESGIMEAAAEHPYIHTWMAQSIGRCRSPENGRVAAQRRAANKRICTALAAPHSGVAHRHEVRSVGSTGPFLASHRSLTGL